LASARSGRGRVRIDVNPPGEYMSANLLSLVQQSLGTDFSRLAGQFIGESEGATQTAMSKLLPGVLGMIAQKGSTQQGAASLMSQINSANIDSNLIGSIGNLLAGGTGNSTMQSLLKLGTGTLVPALFGDKAGGLVNSLASISGVKSSSAMNLLAMVVPLVFSFLKKYIGDKGLDSSRLAALLGGQGEHLSGALDSRVTNALGFSSPSAFLAGLGGAAADTARRAGAAVAGGASSVAGATAAAAADATTAARAPFLRWLPWIIAGAVLLFLWNLFMNRAPETPPAPKVAAPATTTAPAPAPAAAAVAFPAKVYFETGSAAIGPVSNATITAAAAAIKKDSLKVALTGYTDKTGDVAKNEELAKSRAIAVRDALKAAGVAEGNIEMRAPIFVEAGPGGSDAEARRVDIARL
jgi:outer membrane protein OmpA-like peptidoglycan-associated protein